MEELMTQYIPTKGSKVTYKDRGDIVKRTIYHRLGLLKNHTYIVMESKQYAMRTDLYLFGFPGIPFDRSLFDDIPEVQG